VAAYADMKKKKRKKKKKKRRRRKEEEEKKKKNGWDAELGIYPHRHSYTEHL
jgi:hypothetical protein